MQLTWCLSSRRTPCIARNLFGPEKRMRLASTGIKLHPTYYALPKRIDRSTAIDAPDADGIDQIGSRMNPPETIAVTLNWRDLDRTRKCLRSLLSERGVSRVIVSDNESDGALRAALVQETQLGEIVILENSKNLGFARGINPAIRAALAGDAKYIFIINNDAVVEKGAVASLVELMERDENLGLCAPLIINTDKSVQSRGSKLVPILAGVRPMREGGRDPDYVTWAAVLVRTETFVDIGLLDERFFMYWEDVEFCLRASGAGWGLAVCEDAVVVHELSASGRSIGSKVRTYYVASLVQFVSMRSRVWRIGLLVRIGKLLFARILQLDPRGVLAVLSGIKTGRRLSRSPGQGRPFARP
ncbi:glycosyltransferase family 2 protein [Cryobacterium sp. TMT1-2-2]|nr:glycosyltransferase family 2 protein [Cryobacterium sp. TMT1-2-2]